MSGNNVSDIEQHKGTDTPKFNQETSNTNNMNFYNQCATKEKDMNHALFTFLTYFGNIFAVFISFFLDCLCIIQGPPIIIYFLHTPRPIRFPNKKVQRYTSAETTFTNFTMRVIYYNKNLEN